MYNARRHTTQVDVPLKPRLYRHPHGISAVDTEYLYPGHAAAHIIVDRGRAAFVDVGTNASVPYLIAALAELGIAREAVDYVLLTHVHLDHAGGAGALMRELPHAVAVLHPRGAPHMIDPTRLIAGSRAVYGERLEELYGTLLPIPAERVRVVEAIEVAALWLPDSELDMKMALARRAGDCAQHFTLLGQRLEWRGKGVDEQGIDAATGKLIVKVDPRYFRPTEVETLLGDASKARARLGWAPLISFSELVQEMVEGDVQQARRDALIAREGFKTYSRHE